MPGPVGRAALLTVEERRPTKGAVYDETRSRERSKNWRVRSRAGNCPPRYQPNSAYWHRAGRSFKNHLRLCTEILPRFVEIKQIEDAIGGVVDQQYASVVHDSFQLTWQF